MERPLESLDYYVRTSDLIQKMGISSASKNLPPFLRIFHSYWFIFRGRRLRRALASSRRSSRRHECVNLFLLIERFNEARPTFELWSRRVGGCFGENQTIGRMRWLTYASPVCVSLVNGFIEPEDRPEAENTPCWRNNLAVGNLKDNQGNHFNRWWLGY